MTMNDNNQADDRLPAPANDAELQERIGELEAAIAAGEWEGVQYTDGMRESLRRYAIGEIGWKEFGQEVSRHA